MKQADVSSVLSLKKIYLVITLKRFYKNKFRFKEKIIVLRPD